MKTVTVIVTCVGPDGRFGVLLDKRHGNSHRDSCDLVAEFVNSPLHRRLAVRFVADLAKEVMADHIDCNGIGIDFAMDVAAAWTAKMKEPA